MKFTSKQGNFMVVLRPGIPGDRLAGRVAVPGLYVRFKDGIADVKNEEMLDLMLKHPRLGVDFITIEEGKIDPFAARHQSLEPEHSILEMERGAIGKQLNPRKGIPLTTEQKNYLMEIAATMAKDMAKEMAVPLAKEIATTVLKDMAGKVENKNEESGESPRRGRPPKAETKTEDSKIAINPTQEPEVNNRNG